MSRRLLIFALVTTTALAGCSTCQRSGYVAHKPSCGCGAGMAPGRIGPMPMPPGSYAPAPPPGSTFGGIPPSQPVPTPAQTAPPPAATIERPAPTPGTTEETPPSVQLGPPGPRRTESARLPNDPTREAPPAALPKVAEERDSAPPIEVPGYILARPNVATGLKPFTDGITWLRDRGYKAVLHLREPGEDNAAAKRQFEKKGLKYLSLEISPTTLTREAYETFVREVIDSSNHPLYVFDKKGAMVSAMWYLYFRVKMDLDDEKALAEVKRIGLKVDDDDEHKKAWLAAQTLLGTLKP